jgi:beta-lactamase regulating signal transducer with metallopeptidase domain
VNTGSSLALWLGFASLLAAAGVSAASVVLLPRLSARLRRVAPARRARVLLALCLAPAAAGSALALVCLLPSFYAAIVPALDHCTRHADEHLHLCLAHPTAVPLGIAGLSLVVGVVGVCLMRALLVLLPVLRARRVLTRLEVASEEDRGVRLVDSDAAFSFTSGLWRPAVFLSRGLQARLSGSQLAAVLAHERAHARRRDVLRRHLAQLGVLLHAPGVARSLVAALDLASEEACDAEAAAEIGDRVEVAQTIVAVARLGSRLPAAVAATAAGFSAEALTQRVQALLSPPPVESSRPRGLGFVAAAALVVLAPALHHATETILSLLASA